MTMNLHIEADKKEASTIEAPLNKELKNVPSIQIPTTPIMLIPLNISLNTIGSDSRDGRV